MAIQYSTGVRDGQANAKETEWGASPKLKIFSGSQPANCAAANTGTELVHMDLPADPLGASSAGTVAKAGVWAGVGVAAGTAGHYRIYKNNGTTCVEQGAIPGDMTIDNASIAVLQVVTVTGYQFTVQHA